MNKILMTSLKPHKYGTPVVLLDAGDEFYAEQRDVVLLKGLGRAADVEHTAVLTAPKKSAPQKPIKAKGQYQRRDMRARS